MQNIQEYRKAARESMQAMIDRALVQDAVSQRKKNLMRKGNHLLSLFFIFPVGMVFVTSMFQAPTIHGGLTKSIEKWFLRNVRSTREMYRGEIFYREKEEAPYKEEVDEWY